MEEIMAKRKSKPIVAVVGRPNVGKSTCSMHWLAKIYQL